MLLPSLAECAAMLERLAPDLAIAAAGSAIVIAIAAARVATLRRASASARHSAWAMGFGGVLLLPILSAALPGWHVLPRPQFAHPVVLAPVPAVASFQIAAPSQPAQPAPARAGTKPETLMESQNNPVTASIETVVAPINSKTIADAPQLNAPMTARFPSAPALKLSWTGWLVLCWAVGGFIAAGRLLLGHLSLWLLRRRCVAISHGECFGEMSRLKREMGISRPVELLSTPIRAIPMTWGMWKARVVLPEEAAEWHSQQRRDALLHELAHVKRRDCLTQRLSQIACALNWFNPLAWFAARRMEIERERACDDLVLSRGADAPSYARHLLQSITAAGRPAFHLAGAAVAMGRPSTLEERLTAILDTSRSRRAPTAAGHIAMIVLLLATITPVAVLRAQQIPDTSRQPANRVTTPNPDPNDNTTEPPTTRPANLAARGGGGGARGRNAGGFGGFSGSGGFGGSRSLSAPGGAFPVLGQGPTCTLDATIYEVHISIDQIGRLDIAALNNAAETADGFEKALGALGTARPLYRADQSVRLAGDRLSIGANSPYVQATHTGASGQNVNTIGYMATGANFSLAGAVAASGNLDVDLNIQISSASPSGVLIGEKTDALVIHTATLAHKGPVQGNKPFIVLSIDAGTLDKDGKALAYITRVVLGNPQQPAAK